MPTTIEHILPFSSVKEHTFENLVLLCANCHQEVTAGRLGKADVEGARKSPAALGRFDPSYTPFIRNQQTLQMGSCTLFGEAGARLRPFHLHGCTPIEIVYGAVPRISVSLWDMNGSLVLQMKESVLTFRPKKIWDIKLSGTQLKINFANRFVVFSAKIKGSQMHIDRMRAVFSSVPVVIDKIGIHFPTRGNSFQNLTLGTNSADFCMLATSEYPKKGFSLGTFEEIEPKLAWNIARKYRYKSN